MQYKKPTYHQPKTGDHAVSCRKNPDDSRGDPLGVEPLVCSLKKLAGIWLLLLLLFPFLLFSQDADPCEVVITADLSNDPEALWSPSENIVPGAPCCEMPDYYVCFELIVLLHPDAIAFEVEFQDAIGELYYVLNCSGGSETVPSNGTLRICIDDPSQALSLTFCRPGSPGMSIKVRSLLSGVDIIFDPIPDLCLNTDPITLDFAQPAGGEYFINNEETPAFAFDPATYGVGEHILNYLFIDPLTDCVGIATDTIRVLPIPELVCENLIFCNDHPEVILADNQPSLMPGGEFYLGENIISIFDPSANTPGVYTLEYLYTDPDTGCNNICAFTITVNPLPAVQSPSITLCDIAGSGSITGVDITQFEDDISTEEDILFAWFLDEDHTLPVPTPASTTLENGDSLYVIVEYDATGCQAHAIVTFTLQELVLTNHTVAFCDESDEQSLEVYSINLNTYNNDVYPVASGATYEWFEDAELNISLSQPIGTISGSSNVFYVNVTDGICSHVAQLTIIINPLPEISCSTSDESVCKGSPEIDLAATFNPTPAGGTFTLSGVEVTTFNPTTTGDYIFQYTWQNPDTGCENTCSFSIFVNPLPEVTDRIIALCDEDHSGSVANISLPDYEGEINTQDDIMIQWFQDIDLNTPVGTPGNVTVTHNQIFYALVTFSATGCQEIASLTFRLEQLTIEDATFNLCDASAGNLEFYNLNLNNYNNSIYPSAPGVAYNWFADAETSIPVVDNIPQINNGDRFWVVVSLGLCTDVAEITFFVDPTPVADCTGIPELEFCANDEPFDLSTLDGFTPPGGTFSGPGVSGGNTFNPSAVAATIHTLTYTFTDPNNGCQNTCTFEITVLPLPETEDLVIDLCNPSPPITIDLSEYESEITSEEGMTFSYFTDEDLTNLIPDPDNYIISESDTLYVQVSDGECSVIATIIFNLAEEIETETAFPEWCDQSEEKLFQVYDVVLETFNTVVHQNPIEDQTYEWFLDRDLTDPAPDIIPVINNGDTFYLQITFDACSASDSVVFTILPLPELTCFDIPETFCSNDDPLDLLDFVDPQDGIFNGPGVTGNFFHPGEAGEGTHEITYAVTEDDLCTAVCTWEVSVIPAVELICPDTLYFCSAAGPQILDQAAPGGGIYDGPGVSFDGTNWIFEPNLMGVTGVGIHEIVYTIVADSCTSTCMIIASVEELIDVACEGDQEVCIDSGLLNLSDLCPEPGDFFGEGVNFNAEEGIYEFDPAVAGEGTHGIEHIFVNPATGLEYNCYFEVTVHPLPVIDCSTASFSACKATGTIELAEAFSPTPGGGVFVFDSDTIQQFPTANTGTFDVIYYLTDGKGCTAFCPLTIIIQPNPEANDITVELCDQSGELSVDLWEYTSLINNDNDLTFRFFIDDSFSNEISNPETFTVSHDDTVFVLTEDSNGCSAQSTISFHFTDYDVTDTSVSLCDQSEDDSHVAYDISLSDFSTEVYSSGEVVSYTWFDTEGIEVTTADTIFHNEIYFLHIDFGDCIYISEVTFLILPKPDITCLDIVACAYDEHVNLITLTNPAGGTFTGDFIEQDTIFDVQQAGPGEHFITYSYTDEESCTSSCTFRILVYEPVGFSCPNELVLCLNAGLIELDTLAHPPGGRYEGPGILTGESTFNPLVAGVGNHTITYILEEFGCVNSCTFTIIVRALPPVVCPEDIFLCEDDEAITLSTLNHFPTGGWFSGPHVLEEEGIYTFDTPNAPLGAYIIEYHIEDSNTQCINTCSFLIRVGALPQISWQENISFCSNEEAQTLSLARPLGGEYFIEGDFITNGNWFNPAEPEPGNYTLQYFYTEENGCSVTSAISFTIFQAPSATAGTSQLIGNCADAWLLGSATDGNEPYLYSWSPATLLSDPTIADPQTLPLLATTTFRLTVTDQNGCRDKDDVTIEVEDSNPAIMPQYDPICQNSPAFGLSGAEPQGGFYYINNASEPSTIFDPMETGAGLHWIYYILENNNGCFTTAESAMLVYPLPSINWQGTEFCAFSDAQFLSGASPAGGFYSGEFVLGNTFNTTLSTAGIFQVGYSYTDTVGCSSTEWANVTVHALPNTHAGPDQTIQTGDYTTLEAEDAGTGFFSYRWSPGVFLVSPREQFTFTRDLLFSQVFNVSVTDQETGCSDQDEMVVYVEGGQFGFVYTFALPQTICENDTTELKALVSGGKGPYSYYWYLEDPEVNPTAIPINPDIDDRNFEVAPTTTQTYYLKVTDADNSEIYRSITVTVNPLPEIIFEDTDPYCFNTLINLENVVNPDGGTFYFVDQDGEISDPPFSSFPFINTGNIGVGTQFIQYQYTDSNGCSNIAQGQISIVEVFSAFEVTQPDICQPHIISIENNSLNAEGYAWSFTQNPENTPEDIPDTVFEHIFPVSDNIQIYTITLNVEHPQCPDSFSKNVTVTPRPRPVFALPENGCAPHPVQFTNQSVNQALINRHLWEFGDGTSSLETNPLKVFQNNGPDDIQMDIRLTIASNDLQCFYSTEQQLTVYPRTEAGFTMPVIQSCTPFSAIIEDTSINAELYVWDFGDGHTLEFDVENKVSPIEHEYVNSGTEPDTLLLSQTIWLERDNEQVCAKTHEQEIIIFPAPAAVISLDDELLEPGITLSGCTPFTLDLSAAESHLAESWQWQIGENVSYTTSDISYTFINTSNTIEEHEVTLRIESAYGCSAEKTITVEVFPQPQSSFTLSQTQGCSPFETGLLYQFSPSENISYFWDMNGDGNFEAYDHDQLPANHLFVNDQDATQTFNITFMAQSFGQCTRSSSIPITVYPELMANITVTNVPDATPGETIEDCSPMHLQFASLIQGETSSLAWDFGDGSGSALASPHHTFFSQTGSDQENYTVYLTATSVNGCTAADSLQVIAHTTPQANFEVSETDGCAPHTVTFSNLSDGAVSYLWEFGDGNTSTEDSPSHTFSNENGHLPQTYTVTLTATSAFGCTHSTTKEVTVFPTINASFEKSLSYGCQPLTVTFEQTGMEFTEGITFLWDFGDGNTALNPPGNPVHTYFNNSSTEEATYTATLTVSYNGLCEDIYQMDITVAPQPTVQFTVDTDQDCAPLEIQLQNLSEGATSFQWDFGDGSPVSDTPDQWITHTFYNTTPNEPASYTITLTGQNSNECSGQFSQTITVWPEITALFDAGTREGCHPLTINFENLTDGSNSYLWDFGDGHSSASTSPTHSFVNLTDSVVERIVTLYASSGYNCPSVYTDTIRIYPSPKAVFQLSDDQGCAPFAPAITDASQGATTWVWNFGDGNTSNENTPQHTWQNTEDTALYPNITLDISNEWGCSDQAHQSLTVFPQVTAGFTTQDGHFEGCSPLQVKFVNQSTGAKHWHWTFGIQQPSQSANPTRIFTNDGIDPIEYPVKQMVRSAYGCSDSIEGIVTVFPMPEARFSVSPRQQTYPETTVTIINQSPGQIWNYLWDFGDGQTATWQESEFTHTYIWDEDDLITREYTITLTVYNDFCSAVYQQEVVINSPVPLAGFSAETTGCSPYTVIFENHSQFAYAWQWDFGEGSSSYDKEPQHTFFDPGEYEVIMTAYGDGGSATSSTVITVLPSPKADFRLGSNLVYIPVESVEITNLTQGATYYFWEFGDGGTSIAFEPEYTFTQTGLFGISLTAFTDGEPQCSDTKVMEYAVRAEEACMVIFPNAFTPSITGPSGGSYGAGGTDRQIFYPFHQGLEEYKLEIYNRWGELIFTSNDAMIGWDGYVRGRLVEFGVYIWQVTAKCQTGRIINKAGDVTLIR